MNIYDLRKTVIVVVFDCHSTGSSIYYQCNSEAKSIHLNTEELFKELIAISTYEDTIQDEKDFMNNYQMSQWDALNIAIRHELIKETEKELKASDIFEAIAKITKPNI